MVILAVHRTEMILRRMPCSQEWDGLFSGESRQAEPPVGVMVLSSAL